MARALSPASRSRSANTQRARKGNKPAAAKSLGRELRANLRRLVGACGVGSGGGRGGAGYEPQQVHHFAAVGAGRRLQGLLLAQADELRPRLQHLRGRLIR